MTKQLVVISAGLSNPSSTRLLSDRLVEAGVERLRSRGMHAEVTVVEVRTLARSLADKMTTGIADLRLQAALDAVAAADGLIAVTPVFAASYSGLFKMFVDTIPPGALRGVPVLMAATAGSARHSLVLEHAMRPVFAHLKATVVPSAVFAASDDFGSNADGRIQDRVDAAADELAALVAGSGYQGGTTTSLGTSRGGSTMPATADDVLAGRAEVTAFSQLLAR